MSEPRATPSLMDRKLLFVRLQLKDLAQKKPVSRFTESAFSRREYRLRISWHNNEKCITRQFITRSKLGCRDRWRANYFINRIFFCTFFKYNILNSVIDTIKNIIFAIILHLVKKIITKINWLYYCNHYITMTKITLVTTIFSEYIIYYWHIHHTILFSIIHVAANHSVF